MPSTDRLFLGLIIGALVVTLVYLSVCLLQAGPVSLTDIILGFIGSAIWGVLVTFFLQAPIWGVLSLMRVPPWAGSTIAGALACALCAKVMWVLSNHPMPEVPTTPSEGVYWVVGAGVGAVSGYLCWRVAKEGVV